MAEVIYRDSDLGDMLATDAGHRIIEAGKHLYAGGKEDGAREEREAVVAALKRRRAFLAEFFEPGEVRLRDDELDELLRVIEAGEHRKGECGNV